MLWRQEWWIRQLARMARLYIRALTIVWWRQLEWRDWKHYGRDSFLHGLDLVHGNLFSGLLTRNFDMLQGFLPSDNYWFMRRTLQSPFWPTLARSFNKLQAVFLPIILLIAFTLQATLANYSPLVLTAFTNWHIQTHLQLLILMFISDLL